MSDNTTICTKCNTQLVPSKDINYDASVFYDGSSTYSGMVCPKYNPELVK